VNIDPAHAREPDDPGETTDLLRRARAGEVAAFNVLVLHHQDAAYSLALRFLGSRQAAEDVTQEAFERAYRNLASFRGERFRSWLFTIVANAARDELRRQRRRPQRSLDEARDDPERATLDPPDPGPTPDAVALQSELRAHLEAALRALPDDWRLVVVLSDVHGMSYAEVAATVGVPEGTVKSRLSRARGRLRDILRDTLPRSEPAPSDGEPFEGSERLRSREIT
jgi:RNA polymerase sigma-70 factor (ECF subfamily)